MTRLLTFLLALVLVPGAACSSASEAEPEGSASLTASTAPAEASPSASSTPSQSSEAAAKAAPRLKVTKIATGLDHPWDVHPIGQGRLLVTERAGRLSVIEDGEGPSSPDADRPGLGLGRDRPDGTGDRPRLRRQRPVLHVQRRQPPGHSRRAHHGLEAERRRHPCGLPAHPALGLPNDQRSARRLPAADPRRRRPARRHRRRGDRHQPRGQELPRRQDPDARPHHRRPRGRPTRS